MWSFVIIAITLTIISRFTSFDVGNQVHLSLTNNNFDLFLAKFKCLKCRRLVESSPNPAQRKW